MKTIDDVLTTTGREIRRAAENAPPAPLETTRRIPSWTLAVAAFAAVLIVALPLALRTPTSAGPTGDPAAVPTGAGTWEAIPDAPIQRRAFAPSFWSGTEAIFWAGSSLGGGFAYTDGAAYDPITRTWRAIPVPGWGHPGLSWTTIDGVLHVAGKSGGASFDPTTGTWTDFPPLPTGMFFAGSAARDDDFHGLVIVTDGPEWPSRIGIVRLAGDEWETLSVHDDPVGMTFEEAMFHRQPLLWTGSEFIVWNGVDAGLAYDPDSDAWSQITLPTRDSTTTGGTAAASKATMTDAGLAVVAAIDGPQRHISIATRVDGEWRWNDTDLETDDFESVDLAPAGSWLVVIQADGDALEFHVPTGSRTLHTGAFTAGVSGRNSVWTGDRLVVWGGLGAAPEGYSGAEWTPPTRP